jgi:hypothetical protein
MKSSFVLLALGVVALLAPQQALRRGHERCSRSTVSSGSGAVHQQHLRDSDERRVGRQHRLLALPAPHRRGQFGHKVGGGSSSGTAAFSVSRAS